MTDTCLNQDARLTVATPEGVVLYADLADPLSRMWALLIDVLIILAALFLILLLLSSLSHAASGIAAVLSFILIWGYFFIGEYFFSGMTCGKRCLGIQVVCRDLTPLSVQAALWRNVLRYVDFLPGCFGVGLCFILISPLHQRLGDWLAGTVVITLHKTPPLPEAIDCEPEPLPWQMSYENQQALLAFARYVPWVSAQRSAEISEVFADKMPGLAPGTRVAKLRAYAAWIEQGGRIS